MNDIEQKKFKVEKVVYYNSQNSYGVIALKKIDDLGELEVGLINKYGSITACGEFQQVSEGLEVIITGEVIENPRYGKQIGIKLLGIIKNNSKTGVINYLTKGDIEGIGEKLAEKIFNTFGKDSIEIVLHDTDRLNEIHGIGVKTVEKIKNSATFLRKNEKAINYFSSVGISWGTASKLIEEFKDRALDVVKENPFTILEISKEISFKQADEIFLKTGGNPESPLRLKTAFLYVLKQQAIMEGSTGCFRDTLSKKFYSITGVAGSKDYFVEVMDTLERENKVVLGQGAYIYYKEFFDIEREIAEKLKSLAKCYLPSNKIKQDIIEEEIKDFPFELNEQQVKAVYDCLNTNIAVLTGLGGTGKSSITKALYRIYIRCGFNVELLCPTAKACRRLEECTGGIAQTIHKFLGLKKETDLATFKGNRSYSKDTVLIIDEASMMDIMLFNNLLKNATMSTRILLVGDNNQLPSVQAGNVLGDVIKSEKVHVSKLTDIMRQQENSHIIKFCSMINDGKVFEPCEYNDFLYEEFGTAEELKDKFIPLYKTAIEEVGLNEVQVITPYKKGELGMNLLNLLLQSEINGENSIVVEGYKLGDKVRHTQNNYKKDVFNGETGIIINYNSETDELKVDYDYKDIEYGHNDLSELTLSYASTVHASQGSEYRIVFVILDDTSVNDFLHIRRLLYTAVSRGKSKVYILSKPYLVDKCINNNKYRPRITKLKDFLK